MNESAIRELSRLIPVEKRYDGVDPDVWIGGVGSYELALGYSLIFWPRFVEFENYVLREDFDLELLRGYEGSAPRWSLEALVNHIHLGDIHYSADGSGDQLRYLGRILKEIYEVKLAHDFPDRRFTVEFNDAVVDGWLDDDQLTFWQV
ncbi:hypothetical protein PDG61_28500 [Mycolicibacterium sp. BiH015]|uniref:hypothetical protein n=1 Tax=Mycolicibacterium sp. BiH015 TaxID=3018808 RepID=UPI0022E8770E|nr:hypothetical protein [Mycolicibacterium sp. BiH015]MDA2894884.1 hypothetical protein [Mycolicibacterium sp. BiH015]